MWGSLFHRRSPGEYGLPMDSEVMGFTYESRMSMFGKAFVSDLASAGDFRPMIPRELVLISCRTSCRQLSRNTGSRSRGRVVAALYRVSPEPHLARATALQTLLFVVTT
jgi:hypothetical protein